MVTRTVKKPSEVKIVDQINLLLILVGSNFSHFIATNNDWTAEARFPTLFAHRREHINQDPTSPFFPWPDRETCVLDILRHVPRCSFSRKQNAAIHWAMLALGVPNLPSDKTMDQIDKEMQCMCGIRSIRYDGKLGHVYYANDLAAIIAQEMSNPSVRTHMHFLPEDSGCRLSQANQAEHWLKELDPDLLTPVHHTAGQDFFTLEPTVLKNGRICMPSRWFIQNKRVFAKAWPMKVVDTETYGRGWAVQTFSAFEISESDLLLAFKQFQTSYRDLGQISPSSIVGMCFELYLAYSACIDLMQAEEKSNEEFVAWEKTNPNEGNRWRSKSQGKRVVAFPIWLYCDDTSGNVSKKWNKHNSFLFTAAGLPRHLSSKESNIHFLSTSNSAPPLEMLDGIVEQLLETQANGVWAWDSQLKDLVLVIPSVLALLGDNPMQSEFACHIGFRGRLFCRNCWASGKVSGDGEENTNIHPNDGSDSDVSVNSLNSNKKSKRKKTLESMKDMITRISEFMKSGRPRNREETCKELRSQFVEGSRIGGGTSFKRMKTDSGIKDTFQGEFVDRIQAIATRKGISRERREQEIMRLKNSFPSHVTSPVWRIKGLDPHQDTPVEILHVILLGVVKYYWRDAVARISKKDHEILIGRLSSFNTWGMDLSPLAGKTLVNYAGSLTGRDFRALVQAAPFVLHGLLSNEQVEVWKALSALVSLVWQPEIHDIEQYLVNLEKTIDYFLDCTCRLTPRWFNKPKFHVLLHLPNHIRHFGPAMLFATEGFESFNAIIRTQSVHSNRHAPSKDIAYSMARNNRIRHLVNGGSFWTKIDIDSCRQSSSSKSFHQRLSDNPWEFSNLDFWKTASTSIRSMLQIMDFDARLLGIRLGLGNLSAHIYFSDTVMGRKNPSQHASSQSEICRTFEGVLLQSGDKCQIKNWVIWNLSDTTGSSTAQVGLVVEILQMSPSTAEKEGLVSTLTLQRVIVGEQHSHYGMKQLELVDEYFSVNPQDILCVANVQHNCYDSKCPVTRTGRVMKEREESTEKELQVEHTGSQSFILNTVQMRNSAYLEPFRQQIP
ncbi:MAG: hypothetical protein NXY57DRAFT_894227, partial [Lentinula lateritia]